MRRGESRIFVLRRTHSNSHLSVRAMFLYLMSPNVTTRDKPDHAEQCTFRRGLGLTESHPPRLPHRSWQQRSHSLCATSKTDGLGTVLLRSLSFLEGVPSGSIFESSMYRYHLLNYHRTGECPSLGSSLLRFRVVGKLNLKRELTPSRTTQTFGLRVISSRQGLLPDRHVDSNHYRSCSVHSSRSLKFISCLIAKKEMGLFPTLYSNAF